MRVKYINEVRVSNLFRKGGNIQFDRIVKREREGFLLEGGGIYEGWDVFRC